MRIDLRYVIPIAAYYAPTLMMRSVVWLTGYPWEYAQQHVTVFGVFGGFIFMSAAAISIALTYDEPIWLNLGRNRGDDE